MKARRAKAGNPSSAAAHRHALFVEAYVANGYNATEAAKAAGYSRRTARQQGARLLSNAAVRSEVDKRASEGLAKAKLTADEVVQSLARDLRFDPAKLVDEHGNLKPVHELDEDTRLALRGMDHYAEYAGRGEDREQTGMTVKVKFPEKTAAREQAMKHFGLYKRDNEQIGNAIARAIIVPAKRPPGHEAP